MNVVIPIEWRAASSRSTPRFAQRAVPVIEDDTLAARVFEAECEAYPEAIRLFAEGRLEIEAGKLKIH